MADMPHGYEADALQAAQLEAMRFECAEVFGAFRDRMGEHGVWVDAVRMLYDSLYGHDLLDQAQAIHDRRLHNLALRVFSLYERGRRMPLALLH
jgi:hypothetical protein